VEPPSASPALTDSEPARPAPGWIGTGFGVMAMPFTLALFALIAPALWIAGARARR